MDEIVIEVRNLYKEYRIGVIGQDTLREDVGRWIGRLLGKKVNRSPLREHVTHAVHHDVGTAKRIYALNDLSFTVVRGETVGIIGSNGAGKSTLLKILSRITTPTRGSVRIRGRVASLLELGTGFHPELTGRENIFLNGMILGMTKAEMNEKLEGIIEFSGIRKFIDTPVKRYSSGMYVRLAFAVAAHLEPDILILDEVLSVGDAAFQQKCLTELRQMREEGRTIVIVSHNLTQVIESCSRAILLQYGKAIEVGRPERVIRAYTNIQANGVTSQ